ncbi:hypothetical protein DFJ58DRAFT_323750 [Suillus subalutaceus]|uniref:uncharacterized protein n=1 Tax=Suillus subalutaceus TaxID=48586 RepID=UPI001B86346F|nr:uncharacterized protein DFJ58DRAFT_323750 [Suillus subalutaceus]KAG1874776.1 hypothetical protein DFJ58DRAFT_323750 [Suillus subalutaceus]
MLCVTLCCSMICNRPRIPFQWRTCLHRIGRFSAGRLYCQRGRGNSNSCGPSVKASTLRQNIVDVDDSQFTAFVDSIGEDCSGNRQNLALIAATTSFDDTVDFLFPPRILKDAGTCLDRAFLSPLNVNVGEFHDNILGNLLDDFHKYRS